MMTSTPLLDRIKDRRDRRIGPVSPMPVPIGERMSEFSRRLLEKRLPVKDWYNGSLTPPDSRGAA